MLADLSYGMGEFIDNVLEERSTGIVMPSLNDYKNYSWQKYE